MEKFQLSLAAARVNAGMTQLEAAEALGVSVNSIINWEKQHASPSADVMERLSELYNVPIELLFQKRNHNSDKDSIFSGWAKVIVEEDKPEPKAIATFTIGNIDVADGYRVRMTPIYD